MTEKNLTQFNFTSVNRAMGRKSKQGHKNPTLTDLKPKHIYRSSNLLVL